MSQRSTVLVVYCRPSQSAQDLLISPTDVDFLNIATGMQVNKIRNADIWGQNEEAFAEEDDDEDM